MGVPSLICTYLYGSFMVIKNALEGYLQVAKNMLKRVDTLAMALMNTCRIMMDTTMTVMIKMVKQYEKELMDMIYNSIFGTDRSFWCNKLWNCLALLAELLNSNSWLCSKLKSYLERKCRSTQVFNTMDAIAEAATDFLKFQQIVCDAGFTAEFGISYIKQLFAWIKGIVEEYLQFIERQWKRLRLLAESYLNLVIDWGIIDWLEKLISFFMCAFDDSASCAELATAKNFYDDYLSKLKLEKNGEGYDLSREYKNSIYGALEGAKQMAKNLKHEVDEAYDKCVDPNKLKQAEKAVNLSKHIFPGGMSWSDIKEGRWEKHSLVKKYHIEKEKLKEIYRGHTNTYPPGNYLESYEYDDAGNIYLRVGCDRINVGSSLTPIPEEVIEIYTDIPISYSMVQNNFDNEVYTLVEAAKEIKENPNTDFAKEAISLYNALNGWLRNPDGAKRYNDKVFV